jgi:hypothetical protein
MMGNWCRIGKLWRMFRRHLRHVKRGRPAGAETALDRLIAEGRVSRPARRELPEPLKLDGDPEALSKALRKVRGEP